MKEKIFSALKTKFSNLGFSAKAIEGVAESLAATGLVNDENLDAIVEGQKSSLSAMQAEIDSRVTSAVEKAKAEAIKNATPAAGGGQQRTEPNGDNDPHSFDPAAFEERMKSFIQTAMQPYADKIGAFESAQAQAQRTAMIREKARQLGIDDEALSIIKIGDDQDVDKVLATAAKMFAKNGVGSTPPLFGGDGSGDKVSAAMAARQDRKKAVQGYQTPAIKGLETKN